MKRTSASRRRKREIERDKKRGDKKGWIFLYSLWCIRSKYSRPSEQKRSIRNVVSLSVEVASTFWRWPIELWRWGREEGEKRVKTTVIPGFLPLFPIYWDRFTQPFRQHRVYIGDTNARDTRIGFFVFVSRTMGFVSRGILSGCHSWFSLHTIFVDNNAYNGILLAPSSLSIFQREKSEIENNCYICYLTLLFMKFSV